MEQVTSPDAVHVVGGGLAGLTAAAFVARAGRPVIVHEQRRRLGGRATTDERGGFRFNQGPHALYAGGPAHRILAELGIRPTGLRPPTKGTRMVVGGEAHRAIGGPASLAASTMLGTRDKAHLGRVLLRIGKLDPTAAAGLTVNEWIADLTDRERAAQTMHALVRLTTYVNAPATLSAEVAISQLQYALSASVTYLDGGWEQLVGRLRDTVTEAGGTIVTESSPMELPDAGAVVVAVGSPQAAFAIVGRVFDHGPSSEAAVLDLALAAPPAHPFVLGIDEPFYLSEHGGPAGMSPPGRASLSLAQYLAPEGDTWSEPDRARLRSFARHAGVSDDQILDERYLHRMATVTSIATAAHGGLAGRPAIAVPDRPGVFVAGDWVGPVGHLADAALASAREAARSAVAHLDRSVVV